jgi:hypothetical protein
MPQQPCGHPNTGALKFTFVLFPSERIPPLRVIALGAADSNA